MEEHTEFIIKQTITEHLNTDPDIQAEVRAFSLLCLKEAHKMMEFGLANQKLALMRIFLNAAARSVGRDFQTTENEGRLALDSIFAEMREITEATDAAPLAAIAPPVDHSNQRSDD